MTETLTVRDLIEQIRRASMNDLSPDKTVLLLQKLASLLGTVNEEWIEKEMAFNRYYEAMTNKYEKVSEARAKAKASQEYEEKLRSEGLLDVTKELINALKLSVRNKMTERQESRYQ